MNAEEKIIKMQTERGEHWSGYTLEELRYQRALVHLRREVAKEKLINGSRTVAREGIVPMTGHAQGIMAKMVSALDYFDYAYIAYKAGGKVMKFLRLFQRKK